MYKTANKKIRLIGLLMLFSCSISNQAWATGNGFTPVTQCFRNAGAPGWIMQLYDKGAKNNTVPLTAASGVDVAGSGWLRLTPALNDKSGSAYYNLPINVTKLGIQAQFSYTAWGGNGADGISLYLFDGITTPSSFVQGVFGGGLGYCQQTNYQGVTFNGLSNAVVGVGIDDYGNFANNNDRCPNYGESSGKPKSIAVRGPGNGQSGYNWLADNISLPASTYSTSTTRPSASSFFRNVLVNISPATVGRTSSYNVSTSWTTSEGGTYTQLLTAPYPTGKTVPSGSINNGNSFTLPTTIGDAWTPLPPTVKFGFGASTGGSTNYHEIQDAYFTEGLPDLAVTTNTYSESGGVGTFLVTVTNLGSTTATNASITATINGLTNPLWSCIPSSGSSCPSASGTGSLSAARFSLGTVGNVTFVFKGIAASGTAVSDTVSVASDFTGIAPTTGLPVNVTDADLTSNGACTSTSTPGTYTANSTTYTCTSAVATGITTLNLSQLPQTSDSSADNTVTGGQVQTSTQVYIASYNSSNWWGGLAAYNLVTSGTGSTATLSGLAHPANWDAACVLTGGACTTTGFSYIATPPSSRAILTWNGTAGISFATAGSYLGTADPITGFSTSTCSSDGTAGTCTAGDVINYLAGVRTDEQGGDNSPGPFRTRTGVLGDIISSNPVFVGTPTASYPTTAPWSDLLNTSTMPENAATNSYAAYQTAQATRLNVVYVASNDGMVHGFETGGFISTPVYTTTNVTTPGTTSYACSRTSRNSGGCYSSCNSSSSSTSACTAYCTASSQGGITNAPATGQTIQGNNGCLATTTNSTTTTTQTQTGTTTSYNKATNDGLEVLAYMPGTVLSQIAQNSVTGLFGTNYNFTDPSYTHHFFANASPSTGDLYYSGAWHTWLVGGLAGGGKAIYALDVTTPANFSQGNASTLVVKELSAANLTAIANLNALCVNNAFCASDLGWTYGTPVIARMHNGAWAVIFGNGYNSTYGHATVFVASISSTGVWTVYDLQTNTNLPNGIAYVTPYDLDADNVTDYLYAGDLFGNVWRFDVTSSNPSSWGASNFSGTSTPSNNGMNASPIFTAKNASGIAQPISTAIQIQNNTLNGLPQALLMFGTGKNLEASDLLPDNTTIGVQSIYGVWDWNMTAWNLLSSRKFATLTSPQTITRSEMQQQTVSGSYDGATGLPFSSTSTSGYRTLSGDTVCWSGSFTCSPSTKLGFYLDLPSLGEEVLYNPVMVNNLFVVNTTIPASTTQGMTCSPPTLPGGWTMAINPINGGVLLSGKTIFNVGTNMSITAPVSGMFVSAVGTPTVVAYTPTGGTSQTYLINKTSGGAVSVAVNAINLNTAITYPKGKRISWIELR